MTFHNGRPRLAPDAAPGSPHFNNITPFPMARCYADPRVMSSPPAERILADSEQGDTIDPADIRTLVESFKLLKSQVVDLTEERDHLLATLDQLTYGSARGDF